MRGRLGACRAQSTCAHHHGVCRRWAFMASGTTSVEPREGWKAGRRDKLRVNNMLGGEVGRRCLPHAACRRLGHTPCTVELERQTSLIHTRSACRAATRMPRICAATLLEGGGTGTSKYWPAVTPGGTRMETVRLPNLVRRGEPGPHRLGTLMYLAPSALLTALQMWSTSVWHCWPHNMQLRVQ